MNIGNVIYSKRKELGLSSIEVAQKVGVSHATVLRWEQGYIKSIKASKLALLADVLHISPLELLDAPTDEEQSIVYQYRSLSASNKIVVTNLINNLLAGQNGGQQ